MPILIKNTNLFHLCEWGGSAKKQAISTSGLKIKGKTLQDYGRGIPTVASSEYPYYNETVTFTGLLWKNDKQIFPRIGCRPKVVGYKKRWTSEDKATGTWYINRFADGEVWISQIANSRSGDRLCYTPETGANNDYNYAGFKWLILELTGAGGGGGGAGNTVGNSAAGGGGGATGIAIIRLPDNGHATFKVGVGGAGNTGTGTGGDGEDSQITCGSFNGYAGGGKGGQGHSGNQTGGKGGQTTQSSQGFPTDRATGGGMMWTLSTTTGAGGAGGDKRKKGNFAKIDTTEPAPEKGVIFNEHNGGDTSDAAGRGGGGGASPLASGGDGGYGNGGYGGSPGGYPGGGGGGGGNHITDDKRRDGGRGADGRVIIYY